MFDWLTQSGYATWVRESAGWPIALTLHAFGNATIIGLMLIIALRMLGLFKTMPYTSLSRLIPVVWVAVVVQVASGFSLFLTKPDRYLSDGMFLFKLTFVVIGIVLTVYVQKILNREAANWQTAGAVSRRGLQLCTGAAFAWCAVLVMGRLTAYLGQLYHA